MAEGKVVKVAKIPEETSPHGGVEELLATLCFYYPQYTYAAARKLPYKRVVLLIRTARKIEAERYIQLTQIAAAPHTKDAKGVKQLLDQYGSQVRNG